MIGTDKQQRLREKLEQAQGILQELGVDLWLTFVRESALMPDPALDLIVGTHVTWQSAFCVPAQGETLALVGSLDRPNLVTEGVFARVEEYVQGIGAPLVEVLRRYDPRTVALNWSPDSEIADGLTHGMYLNLLRILAGTPYAERLVSAEEVISRLRGRKSPGEIEQMRQAVAITLELFEEVRLFIRPGRTEQEVAAFLTTRIRERGLEPAWEPSHCPAVFSGPDTAGAHAAPTTRRVEPGHVLNIDMGVKVGGYCSDLQRTYYVPRPGETSVPEAVVRGLQVIVDSISRAAAALRPGRLGHEIDAVARGHILAQGYREYQHALGHQIGRQAHDGAALLGPTWERYGRRPFLPLEVGQVFTLEPRLPIEGHGIATIEEMVQVEPDGCTFLGPRQQEIWIAVG